MSDLLQRLSLRATGGGATVRSTMRLPFGAARAREQQWMPYAGGPQATGLSDRDIDVTSDQDSLPPSPATDGRDGSVANGQHEDVNNARGSLLPSARPEPREAPLRPTVRAAASWRGEAPSSAPRELASREDALVEARPPAAVRLDSRHDPAPESDAPPPLLPPPNSAHAVAPAGRPRAGREIPSGALPVELTQGTEVNITIGRIDVTAVHEAPPPKRQARTVPKATSLDEYLARRQRNA